MPIRRNVKFGDWDLEFSDPETEISYFDEGKDILQGRVRQIQTGVHWAEEPVSRFEHIITNVEIAGETGDDYVDGGSGNDTVGGQAGNDQVYGGAGDDVVYGGDGNDSMYGGDGHDWLAGEEGADLIDGGAGINAVSYSFERAVAVRHYGGLGLGLFIARTVVGELGGRISVESSPNAGSVFTVELPQARVR